MRQLCAAGLGAAPHRPIVTRRLQWRHGFNLEMQMKIRTTSIAAAIALTLVTAAGCAVTRGQQTAGAYIDDTAITASVKTRMLDDERVAGTSVTVETLNGTVMLSGFAKSQAEKDAAVSIARKVDGVRAVKNEITVRPAS
jgi:osmotically-inducible protein OsmY